MDASNSAPFKPAGHQTVVPYLSVGDGGLQIEFLAKTFGAEVLEKIDMPSGGFHAELKVFDMVVMVGQMPPDSGWKPTSASLYVYVADVDATYAAALEAGATSIREPVTQPYGDRNAGVLDGNGNQWWFATHVARRP